MVKPAALSLSLVAAASLGSSALTAQIPFAAPPVEPLYQRLAQDAENARWSWGSFQVQPSIGLGDLRYVSDTFVDSDVPAEEVDDIQASLFAGLNLYQLIGERSAIAIFVNPTYSWWNEQEDRRRLNFSAGASAAVARGRFFLDGNLARSERLGIATEEAAQLINYRTDNLDLNTGVEIYRSLAFSVGYERVEREHLLDEDPTELIPDFGRLDTTTESLFAGLRVEPGRYATVRVGVLEMESEASSTLRNFEGSGYQAEFTYNRDTLEIGARVRDLELEPSGVSNFTPTDFTDGFLSVRFGSRQGRSLTLTADRQLSPSVRSAQQDFEATRFGALLTVPIGSRVSLIGNYRLGTRDFRGSTREDDTQDASVGFDIALLRTVALTTRFTRSELESTEADFERDFDRFTVGLTVGLSGFTWP